MNITRNLVALTMISFIVSDASGYALRQWPFEKNVVDSDVVVIGKATSISHNLAGSKDKNRYVSFSVAQQLKGAVTSQIELLVESEWRESDPDCCESGSTYLLLLQKLGGSKYRSTNGPFSVFLVK